MSERRFLLWLLSSVFAIQAGIFGVGLFYCTRPGGIEHCPDLADNYEKTFTVMIATTLALLTGSMPKE